MDPRIRCAHCRRLFQPNPRVKDQRYCSEKPCQRARKNLWQWQKLASDPDYQANQRECDRQWRKRHPDYWRLYRRRHPRSAERNRLFQRARNGKRRPPPVIAKMDASKPSLSVIPGTYYLVPEIAKMDALTRKVILIPVA
jgi:hypothetical protein